MTDNCDTETIDETDFNDEEILSKFNLLLHKYQNRSTVLGDTSSATPFPVTSTGRPMPTQDDTAGTGSEIPLLTEVVLLRSSDVSSKSEILTPMQRFLDAALEDARIKMGAADRKALACALENRLRNQIK
ncbi:MAG: hypothetical protein AABY47_02535 [Pseudomonadota bacterium]